MTRRGADLRGPRHTVLNGRSTRETGRFDAWRNTVSVIYDVDHIGGGDPMQSDRKIAAAKRIERPKKE